MAVNLATKYSAVVDERFALESVTNIAFNRDYDWEGVKTIKVYSIPTAPMNDYVRSGSNRYGTPAELQDATQEMTLTRDRAFTYTIDKGNNIDQLNVKGAAASLARQIREVVVPELDTYRIAKLAANAGLTDTATATRANAYELFLKGQQFLGDSKVPKVGRIAFMSFAYFNLLKLDSSFVQSGNMQEISLTAGVLGSVDGVPLIPVPDSYLPIGAQFLIVHPIAACAPVKLAEFIIHDNPPGIRGNLVEGSIYYDAFVLDSKKNAIYFSEKAT